MGKVQVEADIPQIVNYVATTVNVGTTTTLPAGSDATVTNSGTENNAILDFGIPKGKDAYQQAVEGGYQGTEEEFEAALASDIATVASNVSDINAVGQSITDVNSVADNLTDISTVATNVSDVNTVAGISSDVTSVASISSAVSTVASHDTEVLLVSDNMASVMTTASNIGDVSTVAGISSYVTTVAGNTTDISAVAANNSNITAVAGNATNINAVNANKTNIDAVAGNATNINSVAADLTNIDTAATNIAAITAAPTYAANAATSAANAQTWAEGIDTAVAALGGEHSSKGWANVAKQYAESIGAALIYRGSVATYSDLPSTGLKIGDFYNVLDTGKNYAWTGTEWDDVSGIVDLSAYRTAAAQDSIDSNKVDKTSTASKVYATDISGNQTVLTYSYYADNSTIAQRTSAGQIYVAQAPTADGHAASKKYVDDGLSNKQATLISGTNIKTINSNSILGSGDLILNSLPSQTGQSGKFLTTDGTDASWATVDALPSQTGQSGKFLTTDGSAASWADVSIPNNVYTADNLVAGTNTTITQEQEIIGGNDQYTLMLMHFNETYTDSGYYSADSTVTGSGTVTYADGRFGKALKLGSRKVYNTNFSDIQDKFTLDFWEYFDDGDAGQDAIQLQGSNGMMYLYFVYVSGIANPLWVTLYYAKNGNVNYLFNSAISNYNLNGWNHIAVEEDGDDVRLYINGALQGTQTASNLSSIWPLTYVEFQPNGNGNDWLFDEARLSSICRYNGQDFVPPTGPYDGTGSTINKINCALDKDNLSITTNSSDKLQTVGVIDQNNTSNAIKTWTGTKAQYDAILSKDANTLYSTTDEPGDSTEFADTSLSNLSDAGKIVGAGLGMPSSTYDDLTFPASGGSMTAPANGWFAVANRVTTAGHVVVLSTSKSGGAYIANAQTAHGTNQLLRCCVPCQKGDTVYIEYTSQTTVQGASPNKLFFFYAVGSVSEAN